MATNMPIHKFRAGNIEAAVWSNKKDVGGAIMEFKTVSLSRSYLKKGEDMWRSDVINLRRNDLQKVILVMQKAQEQLLLTERDDDE
ncbi:MAG: hypothetical protein AABX72_03870 [Nanoarchaeota archaeon]